MERYRKVKSPADQLVLDVVDVVPNGEVKGVVQIVHGMQEHKERYLPFMEFLASRGYACVAGDHRGHGKSVREDEDLGHFYDQTGNAIVEDLDAISSPLRFEYPHVPFYMIGHSMGTLVARKYLKDHDNELSGLILSGPVYENPAAAAGQKLIDVLTRYKGEKYVSKHVAKLVDGSFDQKVKGTGKNRWLSANEENIKAFNADPLCGKPFTLNGYRNLMILVQDTYSKEGWHVRNPKLPILFAGGEDDPVIGNPDEFVKMQEFLKDRGYQDVHGKLYKDMRHEILNEVNRQMVYEDFLNFFNEHNPKNKH